MGTRRAALRFGAGLLSWTVSEYAVHRWVMHGSAKLASRSDRPLLHPIIAEHLDHHRRPGSTVPLRFDAHNIGLKSGAFVVVVAVAGPAVGAGFTVGYGAYTGVHDRIHHRRPKGPLAAAMWNHHLEHHRLGRDGVGANFGVTSALWDLAARSRHRDVTRAERAKAEPVA